MVRHGEPPYLECSSRGDKRFSAFFAFVRGRNGTVEHIYQSSKYYGQKRIEQARLYSQLWDEYMAENPKLLPIIIKASGLSDMFGKPGHVCQATELWRIRNEAIAKGNHER